MYILREVGDKLIINRPIGCLLAHGDRVKLGGLIIAEITIDKPFCSGTTIYPSTLFMPETFKDHTHSLLPYQQILETWEAEYRETPPSNREDVIDKIKGEILAAATKGNARVGDNETLQKVSILLLYSASMNSKPYFMG
jgi:hypothetical protein